MTATQAGSATASSGGMPRGWIDPIATYGAVGNGTTDDTTALQSAITAAKTNGGTVYLDPTKTFAISSALDLSNNTKAFRLTGGGAGGHVNTGTPTLKFTGTSGNVLNCHSIFGVEIDHIRIQPSSASYGATAGNDMIDVDGNPLAADCTNFHIHHVATSGSGGAAPRSALRLNKAIIGRISNCHFGGNATNQIRVGDPGGSYVVAVTIENNTYNNSSDAHILVGSGDCEAVWIRGETFEAGTNTPGLKGNSCQLYTGGIEGCWFGDAVGATTWITGLATVSNGSFYTIRGNYFASHNGGVHIGGSSSGSYLIEGNTFTGGGGGSCFDTNVGGSRLTINHNYINNVTVFAGLRPSYVDAHNNSCSGVTEDKILRDTVPPRIAIGKRGGGDPMVAGPTDSTEQLVLAASTDTTLAALGEKAGLYTIYSGGNLYAVVLQAPTFATAREVQIATGTTPLPVFRASDAKLAFYNVAPVAQAARAGQLTDSTGGTVSGTLAAGITDAVAKNAIASLAAKVNALETIIHNLGLSA